MSNGEDDKKTLNMSARIFVANVPVEEVTTKQIKERFMKYGAVSDVYLGKTFAFVQFDNAACAEEAIASESGTFIGENKIDCSLAKKQPRSQRNEDEDDNPGGGGGYGGGVGGGGYGAGGGGFGGGGYGRGGGGGGGRGRGGRQGSGGGGGKFRDRSPMRPGGYEDRYEGRRYDSYERQGGRAGYGGDEAYRDPYYRDSDRDSYRRDSRDGRDSRDYRDSRDFRGDPRDMRGDPRDFRERDPRDRDYYDRDLRDRDRFREPIRDRDLYDRRPAPEPSEPERSTSVDCEIIIASRAQKQYAEVVERRIRGLSMTCAFMYLSMEITLKHALESATRKGTLYAVVVTNQHEVHQSVTVNILHGTPQEHRNMPLDDALTLIGRNFDRYLQEMREKRDRALLGVSRARTLSPPRASSLSSSVELTLPQLLSLLADGRQLTLAELDRVIEFLLDVRFKLARELGVTTPAPKPVVTDRPLARAVAAAGIAPAVRPETKLPVDDSTLQAKILSIFKSQVAPTLAPNTSSIVATANMTKSPQIQPSVTPTASVQQSTIALQAQQVAQQALQQMAEAKKVQQTVAALQAMGKPAVLPGVGNNIAPNGRPIVPPSGAPSPAHAALNMLRTPTNNTQQQQPPGNNLMRTSVSIAQPMVRPSTSMASTQGQKPATSISAAIDPKKMTSQVAGLNLNNPNVQKALENLIQSGPNLLKNLSNFPRPPGSAPLPPTSNAPTQPPPPSAPQRFPVQRMPPVRGPAAQAMGQIGSPAVRPGSQQRQPAPGTPQQSLGIRHPVPGAGQSPQRMPSAPPANHGQRMPQMSNQPAMQQHMQMQQKQYQMQQAQMQQAQMQQAQIQQAQIQQAQQHGMVPRWTGQPQQGYYK